MDDPGSMPKWERALAGLSPAERDDVVGRLRITDHPPRALLFRQGDPSDALVVVRRGRVRLFLLTADGGEFTLSVLGAGRLLGLAACVARRPEILSVEAIEPVQVGRLPAADLFDCLDRMPAFARNVTGLLAVLAMESIVRTPPLVLDTAALRLADLLIEHAVPDPATPPRATVRGLRHEDLAKMVGATRPWIATTLGGFAREGLIRKKRGLIELVDRERFVAFVAATRERSPFDTPRRG